MIDTTELKLALDGVARLKKMVTRGLTELEKLAPTISALIEENAALRKDRQELRDLLDSFPRELSAYAFTYRGNDAKIYNGIYDLETQLGKLGAENAALRASLKDFRVRVFLAKCRDGASDHSTACTIWGDNGQGGTDENFPEPLPCNCGALLNFERSRKESYKSMHEAAQVDNIALRAKLEAYENAAKEDAELQQRLDRLQNSRAHQ